MTARENILARIKEVPELPVTPMRVLRIANDPEAGIADLMRTIEYDPGLTSNVLRLANSAYFAGPRSISSLREAGVRLGAQRIAQLVLASVVSPMARLPVRGYDLPAGQLLDHLIATAVGVEELARALKIQMPPHTFTAALLHDIGKIVLGTFAAIDAAPIARLAIEEGIPFDEAEARILGIDHPETGALLLESWQLPPEIVEVVRWHHQPHRVTRDRLSADLVHVAVNLSMESGIGTGIDGLQYAVCKESAANLRLRDSIAEPVICSMLAGLDSLRPVFGPPEGGTGNGA